MQHIRSGYVALLVSVLFVSLASVSHGGISDLSIPDSPKKWVNDGPYSPLALENKTIVFYFFEED